jgi:hypothetical protein
MLCNDVHARLQLIAIDLLLDPEVHISMLLPASVCTSSRLQGPPSAKATRRTFGKGEGARVHLYRDSAAWCPYCQKARRSHCCLLHDASSKQAHIASVMRSAQ